MWHAPQCLVCLLSAVGWLLVLIFTIYFQPEEFEADLTVLPFKKNRQQTTDLMTAVTAVTAAE